MPAIRAMARKQPDPTGRQQMARTTFQKGVSGNPKGRPPGSRNKLSEDFLRDMCQAWEIHGKAALGDMALNEPAKFVTVAASLIPKEMKIETVRRAAELSDDDLAAIITARGGGGTAEAEEDPRQLN